MQARSARKPPKRVAPPTTAAVDEVLATSPGELNKAYITACHAAEDKQALDIRVLDLREVTTICDLFIICHGRNPRQNQAISDEVEKRLREECGEIPLAVEGRTNAEWILMDYGDFVVHIFSEKSRGYYDLERLYREAREVSLAAASGQTQ